MADDNKTEKKTRAPRTAKPMKAVLVFDSFDGQKFHGLTAHRIDATIVDVIADASANGRSFVQVEIPPASA